jgi:4-hydroxyphenylpyruvate dioxygenase-like putative hemolysin
MDNNKDINTIEHIILYCEDIEETINRFGRSYEAFSTDKDYYNSVSMSVYQKAT